MPISEKDKFIYNCLARKTKERGRNKKKECEEEWKLYIELKGIHER